MSGDLARVDTKAGQGRRQNRTSLLKNSALSAGGHSDRLVETHSHPSAGSTGPECARSGTGSAVFRPLEPPSGGFSTGWDICCNLRLTTGPPILYAHLNMQEHLPLEKVTRRDGSIESGARPLPPLSPMLSLARLSGQRLVLRVSGPLPAALARRAPGDTAVALVLPIEVGGVLVAHARSSACRRQVFAQHQTPDFL